MLSNVSVPISISFARYNQKTLRLPYLIRSLTSVDPLMSDQLAGFLEALVTYITLMDEGASIYVPFMTLM